MWLYLAVDAIIYSISASALAGAVTQPNSLGYLEHMAPSRSRRKRLLQNHDTLAQWVQRILNLAVVSGTLIFFAWYRDGAVLPQYRTMLVFSILLMSIIYHVMGVFRRFDSLEGGIKHLARAWGTVIIILAWTAFLTKTSEQYSRQVVVYWVLSAFMGQALLLVLTYSWYKIYLRKYQKRIPAIIVGSGVLAQHLASSITKNIWLSDIVVGIINYEGAEAPSVAGDMQILGGKDDLKRIVVERNIRRIYIALPLKFSDHVKEVHDTLLSENVDLVWAPDIFEFQLLNHSVREVSGIPLVNLNETPLIAGGPAFLKLLMDKIIALALIVVLSPLLLALAIAVRLSSPGPIIYQQERDGWDGKKFKVYKFRSMYVHEDKGVIEQAKKNDSRITAVGSFIRRTSLDELPQLFNALGGSMSLVGPRPHAVSHNIFYSDKVNAYLARHRIKPGITGWAQINGCRGETSSLEDMQRRVELDLEYISNWSPWWDLKIFIMTPLRLISKRGNAY